MEKNKIQNLINEFSPNLKVLLRTFEKFGFEVRIIGGAVRDVLMGKEWRDIDLATDAHPHEILYVFQNEIEGDEIIISKGIEHGTFVIAFSLEEQYELTSLDFKIKTVGNKIVTSQVGSWKTDALRRDFTINAMSMDLNGKIYDFLNGQDDLKKQKVKFIGDYKKRIQESPILILRFFKLLGKFPKPVYDKNILKYIKDNKDLLNGIKPLTLSWFMNNIKSQEYSDNAIKAMEEADILNFQPLFKSSLEK